MTKIAASTAMAIHDTRMMKLQIFTINGKVIGSRALLSGDNYALMDGISRAAAA